MDDATTHLIYLDYNATTPVDPSAAAAAAPFLEPGSSGAFGNASSGHALGLRARRALDIARAQTAALLRAAPDEITFCSGGTESINTVLQGVVLSAWEKGGGGIGSDASLAAIGGSRPHVVTSALEHPAVLETLAWLQHAGLADVSIVGATGDGIVDVKSIALAMRPATVLVTIMLANNETGAVQPVAAAAAAARTASPSPSELWIHTDASQAVGKIPIDVRSLGVDSLTVAGHKLYAPKGIGATFVHAGRKLSPFLRGASQERGARAGTEAVALAVALGAACDAAGARLTAGGAVAAARLRDHLTTRLLVGASARGLTTPVIHGPLGRRTGELQLGVEQSDASSDVITSPETLPNTLYISFQGVTAADMIARLRTRVACSAGSACHSLSPKGAYDASPKPTSSHVLAAMGVPSRIAAAALRFSVGQWTTVHDVDEAADAIIDAAVALGADAVSQEHLVIDAAPSVHISDKAEAKADDFSTVPLYREDTWRVSAPARVIAVARLQSGVSARPGAPASMIIEAASLPGAGGLVIGPAIDGFSTALVLDQTIAHAQGGGQPADRGVILCTDIEQAGDKNTSHSMGTAALFEFRAVRAGAGGAILHYGRFVDAVAENDDLSTAQRAERLADDVSSEIPKDRGIANLIPDAVYSGLIGAHVIVAINSSWRRLCARLHSAGHLLDLAVKRVYAAQPQPSPPPLRPGKGYHFNDGPYVEYDGEVPVPLRDALPALLGAEMARLTAAAVPTVVLSIPADDGTAFAAMGLNASDYAHLQPGAPVRIVSVGGAGNECACGGTHVHTTAELPGIVVRSIKTRKGKTKIAYELLDA